MLNVAGSDQGYFVTDTRRISASNFRALRKGESLQGFLELHLPSGLVLLDVTLHERDGKRWLGLPSRSYVGTDGVTRWQRLVDFTDKDVYRKFHAEALAAVDVLLASGGAK